MGMKFNPPPGWPVPYGFDPPPGWEPDPAWPPPPPDWPLWMGRDAPRPAQQNPRQNPQQNPVNVSYLPPPPSLTEPRYASERGQWISRPPSPTGYLKPEPTPAAARPRTSGFAIASLALSLVGGIPLSLTFGIVALAQLRRQPRRGKGLAIAGLAISGVWAAAVLVAVAFTIGTGTARPPASAGRGTTGTGQRAVLSLRTGDCLRSPSLAQPDRNVAKVTAVPCTRPHNAQVFVQFRADGHHYPGRAALSRKALQGCQARLMARVVKSRITSTMRMQSLVPNTLSWLQGRRLISCLLIDSRPDLRSSLLKPGTAP